MGRGGAETLIMNIYRKIDRTKLQFDFITHSKGPMDYDDEIKSLGGKIYNLPSLGTIGPIKYIKNLMDVMSANDYTAIHAHTDFQSGFPALAAKICGIKNRICHSHSNNWLKNKGMKQLIQFKTLQIMIKFSATRLCSCSDEAARFLFGPRNKNKVHILNNGIDISNYIDADLNSRKSVLKELNLLEDAKIIGHVGRFSESKNHLFILKILKRLVEEDSSFVALLVGEGPLREKIEKEAEKLELLDHVRFLGVRTDIPRLMNTFDVFLFPSLFEGFGIVMIEAQCSGVPCIAATSVPKSTDMDLGLVTYINLGDHIDQWCASIKVALSKDKPNTNSIIKNISNLGFNIQNNLNEWLRLYGVSSNEAPQKMNSGVI
ncbi:glycosyltransferase family 1 protein [Bacillus sp. FJAT-50079]|nr:glycosyltransferase family 1 protein [Bacillus sp. FJAT-50079]